MKKMIRKFIYYKIDSNGFPINGSNISSNSKPLYPVNTINSVVNAPSDDNAKQTFSNGKRYFIQIDSQGTPIDGTLISNTLTPEGRYLEVYANGILSLPQGSNQNSGAEPDEPEEFENVSVYMSEEYRANGLVTAQFDGKPITIKKNCYTYQVESNGRSSDISYLDCNDVFIKYTANNETYTFCALDGSAAVVFGTGVLSRRGIC